MKRIILLRTGAEAGERNAWYCAGADASGKEIALCSSSMAELFPHLAGKSQATLILSRRRFVGSRTIRIPREGDGAGIDGPEPYNVDAAADADVQSDPWTDIMYRGQRIYIQRETWRTLIPIIQAEGCTDIVYVGIEGEE